MQSLIEKIDFRIKGDLFLKDPNSSVLGQNILKGSIELIYSIGLESFNFKKLAENIDSTEASIYRYFENKHKLLLFLISLYWSWIEYNLVFSIVNLNDNKEKLEKALELLCNPLSKVENDKFDFYKLNSIIISESAKSFLTKDVDKEDRNGYYYGFEGIVNRLSDIIANFNSSYKYPKALSSTIIESIILQKFFFEHLPSISDIENEGNPIEFIKDLAITRLEHDK